MDNQEVNVEEGWFVFILRLILRMGFCAGLVFIIIAFFQEHSFEQVKNFIKEAWQKIVCVIVVFVKQTRNLINQQYKIDLLGEESLPLQKKSSNLLAPIVRHPIYRRIASLILEGFIGVVKILLNSLKQLLQFCGYLKGELFQLINPVNRKLQTRLICPLSKVRFAEPVLLNQCGHTFQKSNIEYYLTKDQKCPICKTPAKRINIKKNFIVENILKAIAQQKPTQITRKKDSSGSVNIWGWMLLVLILLYFFYLKPEPQQQPTTVKDVLTKTYNIINKDLMSLKDYNNNKKEFIDLFNSAQGKSKMTITRNKKVSYSDQVSMQIVKQKQFLTELKISGKTENGVWTGQGYLMPRNDGLYFWMVVTGTEKSQNSELIFESYIMPVPIDEISGKWYYLGHITDRNLSGQWQMSKAGVVIQPTTDEIILNANNKKNEQVLIQNTVKEQKSQVNNQNNGL